jgi:DHA1 family tetracycline resistance protein-like MFS transporter
VWFNLPETLKAKVQTKISFFTGVLRIKKAFKLPQLRLIFLSIFLYSFGWYSFTQIFQVFLIRKFGANIVTNTVIGDIYAYMGVWMIIFQFILTRPLSKRWSPERILSFSMPLIVITLSCLLISDNLWVLVLQIPTVIAFQGLTQPNVVALASSGADEASLGRVLGISQSMQALALASAPMITGSLVELRPDLPVLMGSVFIFSSWIVFLLYYFFKCKKSF